MTSRNEVHSYILSAISQRRGSDIDTGYADFGQRQDGTIVLRLGDQVFKIEVEEIEPEGGHRGSAYDDTFAKKTIDDLPFPRAK